jgi:hypothetical protein
MPTAMSKIRMSQVKVSHLVVFLVISGLAGLGGIWFAGLGFWVGFVIGAGALLVNALAAEWEDRMSKKGSDGDQTQ